MKLSGNFAFPTMLQPVAWLRKIENWKLQSIFNFFFSAKTLEIINRTTQEGEFTFAQLFFLPLSPSLPSQTTLLWKGGSGNSYLPHSHSSKHEQLQCWVHEGSCNNSKKNTLQGEFIAKRKISRQERVHFEVS